MQLASRPRLCRSWASAARVAVLLANPFTEPKASRAMKSLLITIVGVAVVGVAALGTASSSVLTVRIATR